VLAALSTNALSKIAERGTIQGRKQQRGLGVAWRLLQPWHCATTAAKSAALALSHVKRGLDGEAGL
jgi:hypothetical protein